MDTPAAPSGPAAAYHIIPEKKQDRIGNQMMGSTHTYDLSVCFLCSLFSLLNVSSITEETSCER